MDAQSDLHMEADRSLGRVSARAVLTSLRGAPPAGGARVLPHTIPDTTLTSPSLSSSKSDALSQPDSPRVLPMPPSKRNQLTATSAEQSPDNIISGDAVRGDKTPESAADEFSSFPSLNLPDSEHSAPPLSLKISIDEPVGSENNNHGHKKVERTTHKASDEGFKPSEKMNEIVKPDIKLVSPSPTDENPEDQEMNLRGKCEDKIPLTKLGSLRSSLKSKLSMERLVETGEEKEGVKQKLSGKPSSRLSVEHQLLGVSNSSLSNCTDNNEKEGITVNEAIQKAGLGRYHALPFLAAAMVIVLKCFLDGVPDNFIVKFSCV